MTIESTALRAGRPEVAVVATAVAVNVTEAGNAARVEADGGTACVAAAAEAAEAASA